MVTSAPESNLKMILPPRMWIPSLHAGSAASLQVTESRKRAAVSVGVATTTPTTVTAVLLLLYALLVFFFTFPGPQISRFLLGTLILASACSHLLEVRDAPRL